MSRFDDDSLGLFSSKPDAKRGYSMTAQEQRELENTRKMVEDLEREMNDDGNFSNAGFNRRGQSTTASAYTSNPIKSMRRNEEKKDNEIDDLLSLVEGTHADKPPRPHTAMAKSTLPRSKTEYEGTKTSFLDDLVSGEDESPTAYVPTQRNSNTKKSTKLNSDLKQKMGQLFGTTSSISNPNEENAYPQQKQRPNTSEGRSVDTFQKESTQQQSGIEDFSVPFSRRRGMTLRDREQGGGATATGTRPQTTPADQSHNYNYDMDYGQKDDASRAGQDNFSNFDAGSTQYIAGDNQQDDDDDQNSEYVPSNLSRTRDRRIRPKTAAPADMGGKETPKRLGGHKETFNFPKNTGDDGYQSRSQKQFQTITSDNQSGQPEPSPIEASNYVGEHTRNRSQDAGPQFFQSRSQTEVPSKAAAKLEEKLNSLMGKGAARSIQPTEIPQAYPRTEASMPYSTVDDVISRPPTIVYEKAAIGEESLKKILKDTEDYYKGMLDDLRKHQKDDREKLEEAHKREVELLKKEKEIVTEQMTININREKDRMKEIHAQEMETREKLFKYEIERERHLAREESEALKRQLEAQSRLSSLAEEFRSSSNKIDTLFDRIGHERTHEDQAKKKELELRERQLEDREMKITSDLAILERERQRYEKLFLELETKESELFRKSDEERELVRKEYSRLTELQDQLKDKEAEKRREISLEKSQCDQLKVRLERESQEIKDEYRRNYKDLELRIQLFEQDKKERLRQSEENENELRTKLNTVDETRQRLAVMESDLLKKLKAAESWDLSTIRKADELQSQVNVFENERAAFEREKKKIYEIARKTKEESDSISKFKREFDNEKDRGSRMKMELDTYASQLQSDRLRLDEERAQLAQLQRTLEGMRYGYVKQYDVQSPLPKTEPTYKFTETAGNEKVQPATSRDFFKTQISPVQDLNRFEPKRGSTRIESSSSVKNLREQINTVDSDMRRTGPLVAHKTFDFKHYMNHLKDLEKTSTVNGTYVNMEKESLLRSKIESDTVFFKKTLKSVKLDVDTL